MPKIMMRPCLELIQGYIMRTAVQQKFHPYAARQQIFQAVGVTPISD
jgi:hypothetical protein